METEKIDENHQNNNNNSCDNSISDEEIETDVGQTVATCQSNIHIISLSEATSHFLPMLLLGQRNQALFCIQNWKSMELNAVLLNLT